MEDYGCAHYRAQIPVKPTGATDPLTEADFQDFREVGGADLLQSTQDAEGVFSLRIQWR